MSKTRPLEQTATELAPNGTTDANVALRFAVFLGYSAGMVGGIALLANTDEPSLRGLAGGMMLGSALPVFAVALSDSYRFLRAQQPNANPTYVPPRTNVQS